MQNAATSGPAYRSAFPANARSNGVGTSRTFDPPGPAYRWRTRSRTEGIRKAYRAQMDKLIAAVEGAATAKEKGNAFEVLCVALFKSIKGFDIHQRIRHSDEEIDLVIWNESSIPPWSNAGEVLLAECKNRKKRSGTNDYDLLARKMQKRHDRCRVAFLLSWNGFTKTIATAQQSDRRDKNVIVPISGVDIRTALENSDFATLLKDRYRTAMLA